ncbi:Crp/Fnr family transcriptional regulator [Mucilaginibacter sp.]
MQSNLIIESITRHISLSENEQQHFLSLLQHKIYKRKQLALQDGQVFKYSTFVIQGCLRGYTIDHDGNEHVLNFAPAGWWIADMYSLLTQKPGILNIAALEDTEVLQLSKSDQEKLYYQIPQFERFFRIITENSLVAYQQRVIDNMSITAMERYHNFCKRYPTLIHYLPKKQIASYIGVTPEFFSRMQHKILLKSVK